MTNLDCPWSRTPGEARVIPVIMRMAKALLQLNAAKNIFPELGKMEFRLVICMPF